MNNIPMTLVGLLAIGLAASTSASALPVPPAAVSVADLCLLTYVDDAYNAGSPREQVEAALKFANCTLTDSLPADSASAARADLCVLIYVDAAYNAGSPHEQVDAASAFVDCTATDIKVGVTSGSEANAVAGLCAVNYVFDAYNAGSPHEQVDAALTFVDCTATDMPAVIQIEGSSADAELPSLCALTYVNEAYNAQSPHEQVDAAVHFVDCTTTDMTM